MTRVLIAGVSTRGFAESAARAGYEVLAVDGFGDLDLRACTTAVAVARSGDRFSTRAALVAAHGLVRDAVCYVASFENYPRAVAALGADSALWGNSPPVLARVRDPVRLAQVLAARGLATPAVRRTAPRSGLRGRWLVKPRASGGGSGIVRWPPRRGTRLPAGSYLQQRVGGVPGSIVFAADGRRVIPLGVSRALAGEAAFGASGFRYCGSILVPPEEPLFGRARQLAAVVTEEFGLVGVNGIDFVSTRGVPHAIEVNPRYTASMELVERAHDLSVFATHVRACTGALPEFAVERWRGPGVLGKAVVYARRDVTAGDTRGWLGDPDVRDIPAPGERIGRGHPICTIFARGRDVAACHTALAHRAARLYHDVERREARTA